MIKNFSDIRAFSHTPTLSVFQQLPLRYQYQQRALDDLLELQQTAVREFATYVLFCAKKDSRALKLLMAKPFPKDSRSLADFLAEWSCDFKSYCFVPTELRVDEEMFVQQTGMSIPEIVAGVQAFGESTNSTLFIVFERKSTKEKKHYFSFTLFLQENV